MNGRVAWRGAALLRSAPDFPGKVRLGAALHRFAGSPSGPVVVEMKDGSRLRLDPASRTEAGAIWTGRYDHRLIAFLVGSLRPGAVALDIGANIGFYTVPLARRLQGLAGIVHAFEPLAANHARLVENVALNDAGDVAKLWHSALGSSDGMVALEPERGAPTGNAASFPVVVETSGRELAPLTTVDAFAAREALERCDLIKIDVEGGELAVLRGSDELLTRCRPFVVLELNQYWMQRFEWTLDDLLSFARERGYRLLRWDGARFVESLRESIELENVALVPEPR